MALQEYNIKPFLRDPRAGLWFTRSDGTFCAYWMYVEGRSIAPDGRYVAVLIGLSGEREATTVVPTTMDIDKYWNYSSSPPKFTAPEKNDFMNELARLRRSRGKRA